MPSNCFYAEPISDTSTLALKTPKRWTHVASSAKRDQQKNGGSKVHKALSTGSHEGSWRPMAVKRQSRQPVDRPFDIRFAATLDKLIQRLLKLEKCKFCGAVISQRDAVCHRCGKAQV
jgi:hypothetical protein